MLMLTDGWGRREPKTADRKGVERTVGWAVLALLTQRGGVAGAGQNNPP